MIEVVFALCVVLLLSFLCLFEIRRTGQLITPLVLFFALTIVDVFLPLLYARATGYYSIPEWVKPLRFDQLLIGAVFFFGGVILFSCGYYVTSLSAARFLPERTYPKMSYAYLLLLLIGIAYFGSIAFEIRSLGGFEDYWHVKMLRVVSRGPTEPLSSLDSFLQKIRPANYQTFLVLVGVCFYYRERGAGPWFNGLVLPLVGWVLSMTTFYRGSQLTYGIGLLAVENLRMMRGKGTSYKLDFGLVRRLLLIGAAAAIAFVLYGTVRNHFSRRAHAAFDQNMLVTLSDRFGALRFEFERLMSGPSLMGVSTVMDRFQAPEDFFSGKTIFDALLLPVPRSLYRSKPLWYGIDDIGKRIGWPETTQTAITMPGELYANFGWAGVFGMMGFGMLFGVFFRLASTPQLRFIYAFSLLPVMFVTFWMSTTGLMNELVWLPMSSAVVWFVFRGEKTVASRA